MRTSVSRLKSFDLSQFGRFLPILAAYFVLATLCRAQTFNVSGKNKWTDTGIRVRPGVVIQVDATGKVDYGPGEGVIGPDGVQTFTERSDYLVNATRRLGLVARISAGTSPDDPNHVDVVYGDGNDEISIPSGAAFSEGRLWLGVQNDYDHLDNSGEYSVNVSVRLASEEASTARGAEANAMASATTFPAVAAPLRGTYRITVNGFTCVTETWDNAFEVDGKRDEVFFLSPVRLVSKTGQTLLSSEPMSRVMGDTNRWDWMPPASGYRIRAGSASRLGGVMSGDRFPSLTPWIRTSPISADRPTFLVFQGELVQGQNGVVIAPTIWEWDGPPNFLNGWLTAIEDNGAQIAGAVMDIVGGKSGAGNYVRDGLAVGLPAAANLIRGIFGNAGDRMIGLNAKVTDPKTKDISYTGNPTAITLTYDLAELARNSNFGKGPGVIEIQYHDHRDIGAGWYTLYVQVERIK